MTGTIVPNTCDPPRRAAAGRLDGDSLRCVIRVPCDTREVILMRIDKLAMTSREALQAAIGIAGDAEAGAV